MPAEQDWAGDKKKDEKQGRGAGVKKKKLTKEEMAIEEEKEKARQEKIKAEGDGGKGKDTKADKKQTEKADADGKGKKDSKKKDKKDKGKGKDSKKKGKKDGKKDGAEEGASPKTDGASPKKLSDTKAKSSDVKAAKDKKNAKLADAKQNKMLASADAEFLEGLTGVKSRDIGQSTDFAADPNVQTTDNMQSQDLRKSNVGLSVLGKGASIMGVSSVGKMMGMGTSIGSMGGSQDEESEEDEETRTAREIDEQLEVRRVSKPAVLFAYGGEKRGYLIQIWDQMDLAKLSSKKGAPIGKTFMDSQVIYAVVRKTGSTGEFYTYDHDVAPKELRAYNIHSKVRTPALCLMNHAARIANLMHLVAMLQKKIATTVTNVGEYDIRGLVFYVFEVRQATLRLDKSIAKKQAKMLVEQQKGEVLRFACQDPDLLDDWIDAWIKCGAKEFRTKVGHSKAGALTRSMLYSLRDPTNERGMKDFDCEEQVTMEAEVWRKAQEARKNAKRRQMAGMKKKEIKVQQQKKLMKQLSADSTEMMESQDQWRLEMLHDAEKQEQMATMSKKEVRALERQESADLKAQEEEARQRMENLSKGEKKALAKKQKALDKAAKKGEEEEKKALEELRAKHKDAGSRGGPDVKAAVVGKDGKEKSDGKLLDASGKSKKMSLKELKDMKEGGAPSKAGDREARLVKEQKEADKRAAENAKRSTASRDMDNMTASGNWR